MYRKRRNGSQLSSVMESNPKPGRVIAFNMETSGNHSAFTTYHPMDATDAPTGNRASEDSTLIAPETSSGFRKSVHWSPDLVHESPPPNNNFEVVPLIGSNPYLRLAPASPANSFSFKESMLTVKNVLERWGKKVVETAKKAEDLAGNTWQHLKIGPSFTEVALGRIAHGTKIIAEGGYEKVFRQTFETVPEELLQNSFACYSATTEGPVMGTLYASTAKIAFCSDNPLPFQCACGTEWSYYKIIIPLHLLKEVNSSEISSNQTEKCIQLISMDNHDFWFMGFINYESAVNCLLEALESSNVEITFS